MPKTFRAASFAAALTLAFVTLSTLTPTAHDQAAAGRGPVSANGIGWD